MKGFKKIIMVKHWSNMAAIHDECGSFLDADFSPAQLGPVSFWLQSFPGKILQWLV